MINDRWNIDIYLYHIIYIIYIIYSLSFQLIDINSYLSIINCNTKFKHHLMNLKPKILKIKWTWPWQKQMIKPYPKTFRLQDVTDVSLFTSSLVTKHHIATVTHSRWTLAKVRQLCSAALCLNNVLSQAK